MRHCVACGVWRVVCGVWCAVCGVWCVVCVHFGAPVVCGGGLWWLFVWLAGCDLGVGWVRVTWVWVGLFAWLAV